MCRTFIIQLLVMPSIRHVIRIAIKRMDGFGELLVKGHPLLKVRQVVRVELEKLPREEVAAVVKELLPLVKGDDFFALEVLWLLERLDEYGETAFYKKLLKSENMQVQRAAVRSLRWWVGALGEEARGIVARLTKHEDLRLKILLVGALSHLQREDETWGMFLGQIQAKPNGTLSAALMVAGWKDQPGIASEFPLLKVDKAANISHEQWLTKGDGVQKQLGELYFLSEEAGELVIGHKKEFTE